MKEIFNKAGYAVITETMTLTEKLRILYLSRGPIVLMK